VAVVLLLVLALCGVAAAQTFRAPTNDNYLDSAAINQPGRTLDPRNTLVDRVNTATATTQAPLLPGGPNEVTNCDGASFGRTVWYDFYPHLDGLVRLRADLAGGNPVIGATIFNRRNGFPQGRYLCRNDSTGSFEEFFVEVSRGRAYTTQIGGANNTGGNLTFSFDFIPTVLTADSKLRARGTPNGIQLVGLSVTAASGSRVEVACSRRQCRTQRARTRRRRASFRRLNGVRLRAGSVLAIRVTRGGAVGRYLEYRIGRGNFREQRQRCLLPGSRRPRRRCT
jgi:hypothetical protein